MNSTIIARLLDWISATRGITKLYFLIRRSFSTFDKEREKIEEDLRDYAKEFNLEIYPRAILCNNYTDTVKTIIQSDKLGNLPLNTLLIDFDKRFDLEDIVNSSKMLNKNVLILRNQSGFSDLKRVDVWWGGTANGNEETGKSV